MEALFLDGAEAMARHGRWQVSKGINPEGRTVGEDLEGVKRTKARPNLAPWWSEAACCESFLAEAELPELLRCPSARSR